MSVKGNKQAPTPYLDALVALRDDRDPTRLMVPGHKAGLGVSPRLRDALGANALEMLGLDIPLHMRGIDVAPPDPTPLQQSLTLAAEAWGAHRTYFVLGGGSQANHIICLALAMLARGERPRVAVQRNVHQSVIYGLMLADAEVVWLEPEVDSDFGVEHGVSPLSLERTLEQEADANLDAVMVVSPTYHGAVSDVAGLAATIGGMRKEGETLLVTDEAWGAHFAFDPERFPTTAVQAGADIVVSSTHKILGSLTQSAMLHITRSVSPKIAREVDHAIEKARGLVKTTSPSSLLTASLDSARAFACGDGAALLRRAADQADRVRAAVASGRLPEIRAIDETVVQRNASVAGFDPLRVTLDVRDTGLTGREVRDALLDRKGRGVEIEFCTDQLVVLLFGIGDGSDNAGDRVIDALAALPPSAAARHIAPIVAPQRPETLSSLREGFLGKEQTRRLEDSAQWICAEIVAPYPPGIVLVMPGELLLPVHVEYLRRVRDGGAHFADCRDPSLKHIQVLRGGGSLGVAPRPVVQPRG